MMKITILPEGGLPGSTCPRGSLPDALYWDMLDPYHYVRLQPTAAGKDDLLIVGGCDHRSGEADDAGVRYEALEAWIRDLVPKLGAEAYRWSGQVMDTIDYAAFLGRNPGWIGGSSFRLTPSLSPMSGSML